MKLPMFEDKPMEKLNLSLHTDVIEMMEKHGTKNGYLRELLDKHLGTVTVHEYVNPPRKAPTDPA